MKRIEKPAHTKKLRNKNDLVKNFGLFFPMINPNQLYDWLVNNNRNSSPQKCCHECLFSCLEWENLVCLKII